MEYLPRGCRTNRDPRNHFPHNPGSRDLTGSGRNAIVPACGGTGVIGGRPFAAHFVQAVTFAGSVIIPTLDELSGVEVSAAIAFIVDSLTIEHQRTAHSVDIWQAIKGHHVSNDGAHHIRDRRAAVYFDNRFVGDDFVDRRCLRRIGSRGLHAAPDAQVPVR